MILRTSTWYHIKSAAINSPEMNGRQMEFYSDVPNVGDELIPPDLSFEAHEATYCVKAASLALTIRH